MSQELKFSDNLECRTSTPHDAIPSEIPSSDGWTFGANHSTFVLTGSYCTSIMSGTSSEVEILFGCPNVPPPQIIP